MRELKKSFDPASLMISVALASNGFFIKRLVDEVDHTRQCLIHQRQKLSDVQDQIATINARLKIVIKHIPRHAKPPVE